MIQTGDTVTMKFGGQSVKIKIAGLLSVSSFNRAGASGIIICSENTFRQITGEGNYTIIDILKADGFGYETACSDCRQSPRLSPRIFLYIRAGKPYICGTFQLFYDVMEVSRKGGMLL